MYYLINNDEDQRYDNIDDVLNVCISTDYWEDDTDGFDEYLDDGNRIEVCGYDFNPSEVLKELNYDGYMQELRYWAENRADSEREDCAYSLERATSGQCVSVCEYDVYCYDEDDNDDDEDDYVNEDDEVVFKQLEKKILEQKKAEAAKAENDNTIENDFLSVIGIQVI